MSEGTKDSKIEQTNAALPKKSAEVTTESAKEVVQGKARQHLAGLRGEVVGDKVEEQLTPQQKEIMEKLRVAKSSEERVKLFAKVADDIGLDPLLSLIPELGDAGSSIVSGVYLLLEAKKAGLGTMSYLKIIGLQAADFAVGAIPVLGDVADYFFKANKWSAKSFEEQTQELIEKARKAGVSEDKIAKLNQSAEKWPQLAQKAVGLYAKHKAASSEVEPKISQKAA
jgi:hypothetical protein